MNSFDEESKGLSTADPPPSASGGDYARVVRVSAYHSSWLGNALARLQVRVW